MPSEGARSHDYVEDDLERFNEIGRHHPELLDFFMNYYHGVMVAGASGFFQSLTQPRIRLGAQESRGLGERQMG